MTFGVFWSRDVILEQAKATVTKQGSDQTPDGAAVIINRRVLEVCDSIGDFIEYWGFKGIHGRVWALLALSTDPLAQVQIAQYLGVSRSLVSGVIAELVERGLVRSIDSSRNSPYVALTDFWPTVASVLRSREWMLLETVRQALEGFVVDAERLGGESVEQTYNLRRARSLIKMTETAQSILRLLIGYPTAATADRMTQWLGHVGTLIKRFKT